MVSNDKLGASSGECYAVSPDFDSEGLLYMTSSEEVARDDQCCSSSVSSEGKVRGGLPTGLRVRGGTRCCKLTANTGMKTSVSMLDLLTARADAEAEALGSAQSAAEPGDSRGVESVDAGNGRVVYRVRCQALSLQEPEGYYMRRYSSLPHLSPSASPSGSSYAKVAYSRSEAPFTRSSLLAYAESECAADVSVMQ